VIVSLAYCRTRVRVYNNPQPTHPLAQARTHTHEHASPSPLSNPHLLSKLRTVPHTNEQLAHKHAHVHMHSHIPNSPPPDTHTQTHTHEHPRTSHVASSTNCCISSVMRLQANAMLMAVSILSPVSTHSLMPAAARILMQSGTPSCSLSSMAVHLHRVVVCMCVCVRVFVCLCVCAFECVSMPVCASLTVFAV